MKRDKRFYKNYGLGDVNKDVLLKDLDLACGLAFYNYEFGKHELAQDLDILGLNGGIIAFWLGEKSDKNGWAKTPAAQNLEVLKLTEGKVAYWLAWHSDINGWGRHLPLRIWRCLSCVMGMWQGGWLNYLIIMDGEKQRRLKTWGFLNWGKEKLLFI